MPGPAPAGTVEPPPGPDCAVPDAVPVPDPGGGVAPDAAPVGVGGWRVGGGRAPPVEGASLCCGAAGTVVEPVGVGVGVAVAVSPAPEPGDTDGDEL